MKNRVFTYLLSSLLSVFLFMGQASYAQTDPPAPPSNRPQPKVNQRSAKEQLALNYYRAKDYVKAKEIFEQLYAESPRQFYYTYLLNCYFILNEYKDAEKLIKKQRRKDPDSYRYQIDEAYLLSTTGNEKKSRKIINNLLDNLPTNRSQIVQIASALQSKGYFQDALQVYEKAKKMPSINYNYNLEIANAFQYTGDYDKMFDALIEHVKIKPADVQRVKNRIQSLIQRDVDNNLSGILKTKLLEKSQEEPETIVYAEMLLWYSMQSKDFDMAFRQARAIDMRFQDRDEEVLEVADIAFSNKQYELAATAYGYVKDKKESTPFYFDSYTGYYLALVEQAKANPGTTIKQYRSLEKTGKQALEDMGLNKSSIEVAGNLAHIIAFELGNYEEANKLLNDALEIPNLSPSETALIKLELADILLFTDKVWDATLLYSQVESDMKNEPIGHEAKFRNARLFYFIGEFTWAATKLDVLKSATSKLIANDALELSLFINDLYADDTLGFTLRMFGKADMLVYRGKYDSALVWYEKIEKEPGGVNSYQHLLYKKASLFTQKQEYQQADSLYALLADQYPDGIKADNAIFKRAEIQRQYLNNEEFAKDLYMQLMRDYPESIYAGEARLQFRALREGDEEVEL